MYKLHIQEHPFKSDLTMKDIESGVSLREAYEQTSPILPIENARFIVGDTIVEDYDFTPADDEIVCVKLVPEGDENTWLMIGGAVLAVAGFAFGVATGGLGWVIGGIWMIAGGIMAGTGYLNSTSFGDQEAQTMRGGNGSKDVWSPIPVIYGEHFIAPAFAAPDYTSLVESGRDDKSDTHYLHQLYVLGQKPLIIDNVSIGDNMLFERRTMNLCRAKMTKLTDTTAVVEKLSLDGQTIDTYLSKSLGQKVTFTGFSRPQNNKEFTVLSSTTYTVTIATNNDIVDETTPTATVAIGALFDAKVYTAVDARIITDGNFAISPYPKLVNELSIQREIQYGANIPVTVTTPASVNKAEFTLSVPQGLYGLSGNTKKEESVSVQVQVKLTTDTTWYTLPTVCKFEKYKTQYNRDKKWEYTFPQPGQWMIRFQKMDRDLNSEEGCNTVYINNIVVHKVDENGDPLEPVSDLVKDDFVFLALKIKATDQLNGTVNNLNCTIRQGNRVYDRHMVADHEYDKWVPGYSSNPAAIMVDLLTNSVINRYPLGTNGWATPETIPIDWDAMAEWYEFCDDIGYTCNGVVTSMSTVKEELEKIAATGRATFVIRDGLYSVVIDKPKTAVQLFTPRNSYDFTSQRQFNEPFDGIRVKFINKDIGYQSDEKTVFPKGTVPHKFDEATLTYITDERNARRFGEYYYNVKTLRQEMFTFTTDFEYLVCTVGDRIRLQHDVPLIGLASARIASLILGAGQITGVLLDEYVTVEEGVQCGIQVRTKLPDGSFTIRGPYLLNTGGLAYTEGYANTNILTLASPQGNTSLFAAGDIIAFGLYQQETNDLLITNIDCGDDLTATITAVKYDEAIYDLSAFATWAPIVVSAGNASRGVTIADKTSRSISALQAAVANSKNNQIFNEIQPTTPYIAGDLWRRGINMYIADVSRGASESFNAADWQLVTSDTFQAVSTDTFGEAFPEHRWYISPGGSEPVLYSELFSVLSGETTKSEVLNDDDTAWVSDGTVGKLIIPTTIGSDSYTLETIKAKTGLNSASYISGRYGRNGWIGESFTNIYPLSTNSITLTAGTYVLQCSAGSVECSYGTATPNEYTDGVFTSNALVFTTDGETITFTPVDAENISLTKTDFIPPYYETTYDAGGEEITAAVSTVSGTVDIYNRPERFLTIAELYADESNHLIIGLYYDVIRIILTGWGVSVVKDLDITGLAVPDNELDFSLSYESDTHTVTAVVGGTTLVFNDGDRVGVFGTFDEILNEKHILGYTDVGVTHVYGENILLDGDITKLYIGRDHTGNYRLNNQILEITYS